MFIWWDLHHWWINISLSCFDHWLKLLHVTRRKYMWIYCSKHKWAYSYGNHIHTHVERGNDRDEGELHVSIMLNYYVLIDTSPVHIGCNQHLSTVGVWDRGRGGGAVFCCCFFVNQLTISLEFEYFWNILFVCFYPITRAVYRVSEKKGNLDWL